MLRNPSAHGLLSIFLMALNDQYSWNGPKVMDSDFATKYIQ